jgi:hypothetical protein
MSLRKFFRSFKYFSLHFLDFKTERYAHIYNRIQRLFRTSHHSSSYIDSNWLLHLISGQHYNSSFVRWFEVIFIKNYRSFRVGKSVHIDGSSRRNCSYNRFLIIRIYFQVVYRIISRFMFFNIRCDFIDSNLGRDVDRYLFSQN